MNPSRPVAIVTGAGPGIGRATARALAADGYDLVLAARRPEPLAAVSAEIETLGAKVLAVPTDVGDLSQCAALVDAAVARFERIDVLVNSAAKGAPNHAICSADLDDWQAAWQINVLGPVELARRAMPHLFESDNPSVIMVSTLAVRAINPGQAAYAATKAALGVAAQTLAKEVGPQGVRVNIVVPGFVPGPNAEAMFGRMAERRGMSIEEVQADLAARTALHRLPVPDDIADAIAFLVSPRARSITGQTLDVNGGNWMT